MNEAQWIRQLRALTTDLPSTDDLSALDVALDDPAAPDDTPVEITMKAGKGFGWLARQLNAALEGREGFAPLSGAALKQRMGGVMLYRGKAYTFQPSEVLAGGPLSGGQSDAQQKKARKAADWWNTTGREEWKAQQAEAELEARIAAEAEARAAYLDSLDNTQTLEDPEVLEAAHLEDERRAQQAHVDSLENTQTLEDPEVIAQGLAEIAAREEEQKKKALLDKLWALHKTARHTRSQANTSADYYRQHGVDNDQNDRKIAKMEATRDAAVALRDDVMTSIATLSTGEGYRDDITVAELEGLLDKHRRAAVELDIDLQMEAEKARPDSSAGGAAAYTATATGVATLSAANGVASEVPVVGELYERHVGSEVRADLTRDASGKLDREMAEHAVASGEAIGKTAATVVQLANPTHAAVVADTAVYGTVEAAIGEDVAKRRKLSDGERGLGLLGAAAAGLGKLATLDPTTKMSQAIAAMEGTQAAPTVMSQLANGTSTAKKVATVADQTTAAVTGRRLFRPELEQSDTARALSGVSAVAGATGLVADNTQTGKLATAMGERSATQDAATVMGRTVTGVKVVDGAVTAATGYSITREKELGTKQRVKAAGAAISGVLKEGKAILKEVGDDIARDAAEGLDEAFRNGLD